MQGMEELDEEVDKVRGYLIGDKSNGVYIYGILRLIVWLHKRIPTLVKPSLREMLDSDFLVGKQTVIRSFMDEHDSVPPIALSDLPAKCFERFLISLR